MATGFSGWIDEGGDLKIIKDTVICEFRFGHQQLINHSFKADDRLESPRPELRAFTQAPAAVAPAVSKSTSGVYEFFQSSLSAAV